MKEFYLISTENRFITARMKCHVTGEVEGPGLRVRIHPPIPPQAYDTKDPVYELDLFPRHVSAPLLPRISVWPCYVNICLVDHGQASVSAADRFVDVGRIEP